MAMPRVSHHHKYLWVVSILLMCACAAHFNARRMETANLYTARSFLIGAEAEADDYGLYSYLLFPSLPTADTQARFEAAVRAFLAQPPASAADELLPHKQVNIFYLLLIKKPVPEVEGCLRSNCLPLSDEIVTAILSQYNYARARIIADRLGLRTDQGPYIATCGAPVSIAVEEPLRKAPPEALVQNLSAASPHLVNPWVTLFIQKATGKGSAHNQNLRKLLLHLQTALENYAQGLPRVFEAGIILVELKNRLLK
jgi:hypothetical protein